MATNSLLEFYDQNTHRAYPLVDDASGLDTAGNWLPNSFLVDLSLMIPSFTDGDNIDPKKRFFISAVTRTESVVRVEISYRTSNNTTIICGLSEDIPATTTAYGDTNPQAYMQFRINPTITNPSTTIETALSQLVGTLRIGTVSDILSTGSYAFSYNTVTPTTTINDMLVWLYDASGIKSVTVQTDTGSVVLDTDFIIKAGENVTLSLETVDDVPVLTISAAATTSDLVSTIVDQIITDIGTPIKQINGVAPDSSGNFTLLGADCIETKTATNGLVFNNPCSKPCCGDADSQAVSNAINSLEDAKDRLMEYYQALTTNVNALQARLSSVLAAKGGLSST